MNVLIVDDEQTALNNLERVLKKVVTNVIITKADEAEYALKLCRDNMYDIVFLDINMPDKDGMTLAEEIKKLIPIVNIIIVTAYPEYALEAYKLYVSDYIMKPVIKEDLKKTLANLRIPIKKDGKGLYIQCFGDFVVFFNGKAVSFGRAKTKELLAYLIDRKGAQCTNAQIRAALWGDSVSDDDKQRHYFAQITYELRSKLEELNISDIFVQSRDSYAIVPEKIPCDYYQALDSNPQELARYEGEYMSQYEWAQMRVGIMNKNQSEFK